MGKFTACVLAAFVGWAGLAAALDVRELQAKLAAREAALNDIGAKLSAGGDAPGNVTSMMKNAAVTVGGLITTGYFHHNADWDTDDRSGSGYQEHLDLSTGDMQVSDAKVEIQADVGENFDACVKFNLHGGGDANGLAESAWIRWKNIRDTGFGIKIGRDTLVFGDGDATLGYLYTFANNDGDGAGWWWDYETDGDLIPHNGWDRSSVTQIAPYWELMDGRLLLEASFFAHMWNDTDALYDGEDALIDDGDRVHSRNYGLGSMSLRATWNPTENLRFSASAVNYHSNGIADRDPSVDELAKNNTAVALSFSWTPARFDSFTVWGQYVRGRNVNHCAGADSDALNIGVSYSFTDKLTAFVQGDSIRGSYENLLGETDKYRGRAFYAGLMHDFGNGVSFEAGWRHERVKRDFDGADKDSIRTDTVYTTLAFDF